MMRRTAGTRSVKQKGRSGSCWIMPPFLSTKECTNHKTQSLCRYSAGDKPSGFRVRVGEMRRSPELGGSNPNRRVGAPSPEPPGDGDVNQDRRPQEHPIALGNLVPLPISEQTAEFARGGGHEHE